MARLPFLRQIIDPVPNSGQWNMAVDQVLLQSAIDDDVATLRWYTWNQPTVSIGYFQRDSDVLGDARLAMLPRVRRLSGGGTLVHDHELTYSLALPGSQRLIDRPVDLYRLIHQQFVEVLAARGAKVALRGLTNKRSVEPVLCFAREDEHDLVAGGFKVLGSAQRRRRGAILQHGGLLLGASPITPELPGIRDLCPLAGLADLAPALGLAVRQEIADSSRDEALSPRELEQATALASSF